MEKKKVVLTEVSGIGEKRESQLKAIGINSVDDLAKASVEDLAKRLKVSPKIVAKWVASAKQLQQK
ncbi:MAG: helix-hairpin-helix domain-containing protein [Candidatus Bathyarchaeia archaeon]|jgi:predicted flap endonuclease-1-like 5' DNA nuclease